MRILLDECVNPRLKEAVPGHDVKTVREMGWQGFTNGQLLDVAEPQFDVFLTLDRNLEYQQNLRARAVSPARLDLGNEDLVWPTYTRSGWRPPVRGWAAVLRRYWTCNNRDSL